IARPMYGQESIYNRWKRMHCLKYQTVIVPNRFIDYLYRLMEGGIYNSTV
ncbi:hypothetical protein C7212DRAFT_224398, partial [Tuber magnatum]